MAEDREGTMNDDVNIEARLWLAGDNEGDPQPAPIVLEVAPGQIHAPGLIPEARPALRAIPRLDANGWYYLIRYPDGTVVQCAGDWDIANKHLRLIRSESRWPKGGPVPALIGAYQPWTVGGPEGKGGVFSYGYSPNLIGSIDHPRDEWIPA